MFKHLHLKPRLLALIIALFMSVGTSLAQQTLTVCDGTVTDERIPITGFCTNQYGKQEFIFPASMLSSMTGKTIAAMKCYSNTTSVSYGSATFQVFLKEVGFTTITDYQGTNGATIVYEGSLSVANGELNIQFTTPYTYQGGNLLIGVYNPVTGSSVPSTNFYGVTADGASIVGWDWFSLNDITASNSQFPNFLPKTTFSYNAFNGQITASVSPEGSGTVSGTGTYTGGSTCTLEAVANGGYYFLNWTENGTVVSTTALYSFMVDGDRSLVANFAPSISQGAVSGHPFKVNANGGQVLFSQGNMQYIGSASTPYWKFAEHQWDYLGDNGQGSTNSDVDRDLFGWGTSGYNHGAVCYQPWSTIPINSKYYAYGSDTYNLFDQTGQADWGYNAISNGGNTENCGWRTLTKDEWEYIFDTRSTASGIRYAKAKVNYVNGVILLPDDWSTSYYTLNSTNSTSANFTSNTITASQWNTLEQHGAVFLPAAGCRLSGTSVSGVGDYGYYWSASCYDSNNAYNVYFLSGFLYPSKYNYRYLGRSVRLVAPAENFSFGINATPNPAEGGTVSGGGAYAAGTDCTLTATPSAGYTFINWMENGTVVSTDATYTFTVYNERNLVANFVQEGNITFSDANVKALCVANWDTNGDGELSYAEVAAVTSLGNVFKNKTNIHSFNELQYFIWLGSIGDQAFYGCTALTLVSIPERVTTIGSQAFWNCPALQTVTFNAINCTSMQTSFNSQTYSVFSEDASGSASNVKSVVLGANVQRIPDYAFKNCVDIYPGLTIRNSVTEIGAHAFEGCSSMTNLAFQSNSTLATIGDYAFNGCSALNKALNLPNSVTTVGQYAFYGCVAIPSLTIGTGMESIGGYAFWNCPAMTTVNFNATNCTAMVTDSQYSVFNSGTNTGATPIVTLSIGSNVTKIPDYAFRFSTKMTSVIMIPDATTRIGTCAFYGAKSTELTIGTGVTTIGEYAFWYCPNLATVNFNATNCTTMGTSQYSVFNSGMSDTGATPIVTLSIGSNVTKIPDYAFRNSTNMTSAIIIPNATTTIGTYAFYGAKSTELTIGTGVTSIGGYAFWNCPNLATVHFNATNCTQMLTNIGSNNYPVYYSVFSSGNGNYGETPIVTLTIGENVTKIPNYAFRYSNNMTCDILIPDAVTSIGTYAFANCSGHNVIIGSGVTNIIAYAFYQSSGFNGTLLIGDAVEHIGSYAFSGCSGLSSSNGDLVIPDSVTVIGDNAFSGCTGFIGSLSLPVNNSFTTIHAHTFDGCSGLSGTLTIPSSVTNINNYAFRDCGGFTATLVLHNTLTSIGDYAFYGCYGISDLTIGEGVTSIGDYAFWQCPNLTTVHFNATNCIQMHTQTGTNNNYVYYSVFNSDNSNGGATPIVTLYIGKNVTKIPDYAFRCSNNMTCDIIIPDAVTLIGTYAFANCSGHNVFTGKSVSNIPEYTFYQSSGFNGTLFIGDAVTSIGQYAFQGCFGFTGDLVIPNAVTTLGRFAFSGCSGFNGSLIIGTGVQTINQNTFAGCSGFAGSLILGTQVNSIGNNAFQNCNGFALLITENPNPVTATSSSFTGMNYSVPVYVPDGLIGNYQSATGWNNFTNYIEQFTFWQELDTDNWSDEMNWLSMELPSANDVVCISYNCEVDIDVNVLHVYVYNVNDALTVKSGKTLTTTYGLGIIQPSQLVMEEGSQLYNTIPGIYGTVLRQISGYGTGNDGWYTIAAPIYGGMPVSGLTTGTYDLYSYDEPTAMWLNEKVEGNFDKFNPAQGYLYANQSPKTVNLAGQLNASNAEISIPVTYTAGDLAGFNLVGNPYTNNINIGDVKINGTAQTAFYRAEGGSNLLAYVAADNEPIKPGDGFFVKATEDGTLTFGSTQTRGEDQQDSYVRLVLRKNGSSTGSETIVADRAYLRMNEGERLEKMCTSTAHSLLYFENGGSRYAVANNEAVNGVMPLFLEKANGTYSIEATLLNAECDYLHLVDNMTGKDIDLLETPVYSFEAKTTDYASRFNLVFSSEGDGPSTGSGTFAFIDADGNIIVNNGPSTGSGTSILQVVDVTGRIMMQEENATSVSTSGMTPGVYVLRLINGDSVRTQKIVVK